HPLGPESEAPGAATVRGLIVELMAAVPVGTALEPDALRQVLGWHRPRLARVGGVPLDSVVSWTCREAGWLGITSLGAVSGLATAAVEADARPLPGDLADAFPATVETIVLQADLTAVAPGPVPYRLARDLRLLADQESRGGAAVFRFSGTTLRRALDAGWSAADVRRWLEHHASTTVPQPLTYLIDDVARQHGSIRVGPANAYVRIDDAAEVAGILTHPDASVLGLRELAPGILVAAAEPYEVVDFLHRIGHSPAAEDSSGRSVTAPDPLRAPRRSAHRPRPDLQAGEAAAAVLAGERQRHEPRRGATGRGRTGPPESTPTAETLQRLADAQESRAAIRIRYVAADGQAAERELRAVRADAGRLVGTDPSSAEPVTIPLSRVSSVGPGRVTPS
ncbi:MAG TPA: helicase-associated domain-containing protein, partial [Microlunatus sp.]|nr:helicase-associated domain-containing protein [Microlunatus sp.]